MQVTVSGATQIDESVWTASLLPGDVKLLGPPKSSRGLTSVVLIDHPEFRAEQEELRFVPGSLLVLNAGTGDRAIFIDGGMARRDTEHEPRPGQPDDSDATEADAFVASLGPGDRRFVDTLRELPIEVRQLGIELLRRVRREFPGDLRPYPGRKFIETTPKNFWGVTVQVRLKMFKITVLGAPDRFSFSNLDVSMDRPPSQSGFKLETMEDLDEAIKIIRHAGHEKIASDQWAQTLAP